MIKGQLPNPTSYEFDFQDAAGAGALSTGFDEAGVSVLAIPPARTLAAEAALLNGKHLKGVLDTFSAALALARTEGKSPCERKIEILTNSSPSI